MEEANPNSLRYKFRPPRNSIGKIPKNMTSQSKVTKKGNEPHAGESAETTESDPKIAGFSVGN